ncbi:MAG TPA: RDD family protein [Puia sp.]|nr:RDD family protein [Puia sp.]
MQTVKLDTGFNIEIDFIVAPFHKRLFAWLIDMAVIAAYLWLVAKILSGTYPNWLEIITRLPIVAYFPFCEIFMNGQSLGKKAVNIQVIAQDGGQPTISQFLIRSVFRLIDLPALFVIPSIALGELPWWCMVLLFTGIGSILVTRHSQRVGDLVAGTIIIDRKNRLSWQDTVFTELDNSYQPSFSQVMQLSDKDINTLKSIIESVKKNNNFDLSMRIAQRIKTKLNITSHQDSIDFLETLLKDYNYFTAS